MSLIVLGSVRSCGVTTLAAALAATWPPDRRLLVIEADPAGGSMAALAGWAAEPSLMTLAAAARRNGETRLIWEHCQQVPGGSSVVAAPASSDQTRTALELLEELLTRLSELDVDVLVYCGRLPPDSPTWGMWDSVERKIVVVRPRIGDLQSLATWFEVHDEMNDELACVAIGDGAYPDREIAEALGLEVLARVPWDPGAAEAVFTLPASAREVRMAPLVRSARTLGAQLAGCDAAASLDAPEVSSTTASRRAKVRASMRRGRWARSAGEVPASLNGNTPEEASR